MPAMNEEFLPHYTYDDYCLWEGRWELINGVPYAMSPSAVRRHQEISGNISFELSKTLGKNALCRPLFGLDWKIAEETVVCPDNLVVCGKDIGDKFLTKAPEIIFEILSPSTSTKDKGLKFHLYQEQGVKYYCLVDPLSEKVEVFVLRDGKYSLALETKTDKFLFEMGKCTVELDFNAIW